MAVGGQQEPNRLNSDLSEVLVAEGWLRSRRVEAAFRSVLRHWFLPGESLEDVYSGKAMVTRRGPDGMPTSSSSEPRIMARMLEQLGVEPGHRVLEIGTGTGYNAALLGYLVGNEGSVTTVDIDPVVTAAAAENLRRAGFGHIAVVTGDGWAGVPAAPPFDRIEATVGVWDLAPAWVSQLGTGGILTVPLWLRAGLQASVAFHKCEEGLKSLSVEPCGFMRLQGLGAGPESYMRLGRWTVSVDGPGQPDVAVLNQLLQQQARSQPPPALAPSWFTGIALSSEDAVMLTDWEAKATLSGLLDPAGPSLALIEAHCRGAEQVPRALHSFGTDTATERLLRVIQDMPAIGLNEIEIQVTGRNAVPEGRSFLSILHRPNAQFLLQKADRK